MRRYCHSFQPHQSSWYWPSLLCFDERPEVCFALPHETSCENVPGGILKTVMKVRFCSEFPQVNVIQRYILPSYLLLYVAPSAHLSSFHPPSIWKDEIKYSVSSKLYSRMDKERVYGGSVKWSFLLSYPESSLSIFRVETDLMLFGISTWVANGLVRMSKMTNSRSADCTAQTGSVIPVGLQRSMRLGEIIHGNTVIINMETYGKEGTLPGHQDVWKKVMIFSADLQF